MLDEDEKSLAGRVLSLGNPFGSENVLPNIEEAMRAGSITMLEAALEPFISAATSLAGHILADAADEKRVVAVKPARQQGKADALEAQLLDELKALEPIDAFASLLKGMFPAGVSLARMAVLLDVSPSDAKQIAKDMRDRHMMRIGDDGMAVATNDLVADAMVLARPWPARRGGE